MNVRKAGRLLKEAVSGWSSDYASSMGAALSYYTLFSLAPLLLIVISVAGLVFGKEAAHGALFGELQGLMGADAANTVQTMLASVDQPAHGIAGTITGLITMLIGATTVFGELQNDLDRIWRAPVSAQASGLWRLLRSRLLSFGLILGVAFLLMVSLVVSTALAALGKWWAPFFGAWEALLHVVNLLVGFGITTVLFAMMYKWLPRADIGWRDVWIGAAFTSLLFGIGKFLIGLYLGKSGVASGFGAAGSLVLMMLWVYYSAQIFLLGAEFTRVYAHAYGSRRAKRQAATPPAAAEKPARSLESPHPGTRATLQPVMREPAYSMNALAPSRVAVAAREARERVQRKPYAAVAVAAVVGVAMAALTGKRPRKGPVHA